MADPVDPKDVANDVINVADRTATALGNVAYYNTLAHSGKVLLPQVDNFLVRQNEDTYFYLNLRDLGIANTEYKQLTPFQKEQVNQTVLDSLQQNLKTDQA